MTPRYNRAPLKTPLRGIFSDTKYIFSLVEGINQWVTSFLVHPFPQTPNLCRLLEVPNSIYYHETEIKTKDSFFNGGISEK
jgi:hypothetical protein